MFALKLAQRPELKTQLKLSQRQIFALRFLSLSKNDMKSEIKKALDENPALKIAAPAIGTGVASANGNLKADEYQKMYENIEDNRETLADHLLEQLNLLHLTETEKKIGERLVYNLDKNGCNILLPSSLLEKSKSTKEKAALEKMVGVIQSLDPTGCCVKDYEESLFVQAINDENAVPLSKFILDGHFSFLDPPEPTEILKKIKKYRASLENMTFLRKKEKDELEYLKKSPITETEVKNALSYIRTLNPHPGLAYAHDENRVITPDVRVEKIDDVYKISVEKEGVPNLLIDRNAGSPDEISEAQVLIDSVNYRYETLTKATEIIVKKQLDFFENGSGNLKPFLQKDLAEAMGVSESTISRLATGKYLNCKWGNFPFSHFFTSEIKTRGGTSTGVSQEMAKSEIKKILASSADLSKIQSGDLVETSRSEKPLSDKKIAEELEKIGIKISRRTVAKYRSQLGINSSYSR